MPYKNKKLALKYHKNWYQINKKRINEQSRERLYHKKYNLSFSEYDAMVVRQGGRCSVCGISPKNERLSVDHDHQTGKVRGLLCRRCNSTLSWVKDSSILLRGLAEYLEISN